MYLVSVLMRATTRIGRSNSIRCLYREQEAAVSGARKAMPRYLTGIALKKARLCTTQGLHSVRSADTLPSNAATGRH